MKMINKKQLDYLSDMDIPRLMQFLNNRTTDELDTLVGNIKEYLTQNNLNKEEREKYKKTLSYVEAKRNGSKDSQSDETAADKRSSITKQLLNELLNSDIEFFHDQYKEGYVALEGNGRRVLKLRSKVFRQ